VPGNIKRRATNIQTATVQQLKKQCLQQEQDGLSFGSKLDH
jgi:hypothetical protein